MTLAKEKYDEMKEENTWMKSNTDEEQLVALTSDRANGAEEQATTLEAQTEILIQSVQLHFKCHVQQKGQQQMGME